MQSINKITTQGLFANYKEFTIINSSYDVFYVIDCDEKKYPSYQNFKLIVYNHDKNKQIALQFTSVDFTKPYISYEKDYKNYLDNEKNVRYGFVNRMPIPPPQPLKCKEFCVIDFNQNNNNNNITIDSSSSIDVVLLDNNLIFGPYGNTIYVCDLDLNLIKQISLTDDKYTLTRNFLFTKTEAYDINKFELLVQSNFDEIICWYKYIICKKFNYNDYTFYDSYTVYNTKTNTHVDIADKPITIKDGMLYVKTETGIELLKLE